MRDQERNLANFTVARRKHSGGLLIGTVMKIRMPSAGRETGGGLDVIWRKMSPVVMFLAELIQFPFLTTNFAVQRLLFSGVRRWEKAYHMAMEYKLQVTCL